jgi:hypothetical protein
MNNHEYTFMIIPAPQKIDFIHCMILGTMCGIIILKEFPLKGRKEVINDDNEEAAGYFPGTGNGGGLQSTDLR